MRVDSKKDVFIDADLKMILYLKLERIVAV